MALLLLVFWGLQEGSWWGTADRERAVEGDAPTLDARTPPDGTQASPRLEPAPGATPRATHGPVSVRVQDAQARPCAGVRVEAWIAPTPDPTPDPKAEESTSTYTVQRALSDASGVARFDDLPYDGSANVRALARLSEEGNPEGALGVVTSQVPLLGSVPVLKVFFARDAGGADPTPAIPPEGIELGGEEATIMVAEPPSPDLLAEAPVEGPEVTLAIEAGLPLHVTVREGGGGRPRRDARTRVRPRIAWEAPTVGETRVLAKPGNPATVQCLVEPPEGWVARKEAEWTATIHPLATRLEAVYPLRPALDVIVELPQEVMPYRTEDWEGMITVAGVPLEAPLLRVDAAGRLHVRGGSYLVGDRVEVHGSLGQRWIVLGVGYIGPDPRQPVQVVAEVRPVMPPAQDMDDMYEEEIDPAFLIGGPGLRFPADDHRLRAAELIFNRLLGRGLSQPTQGPSGPLTLRVVAWDGSPAAGAHVRWQGQERVADAHGRVRLEGVPPGTHRVQVLGAGAPQHLRAEVGSGPRGEVLLCASAGATLEVEVLDTLGRALPFAHVDLTLPDDQPLMDCMDGVQRLDPYTDAAGRRTYRFVTPGQVKVKAYFGSRNAEVRLEVADGATVPVRIALPVHAPPAPPDVSPR